jgi:hypothetical protein
VVLGLVIPKVVVVVHEVLPQVHQVVQALPATMGVVMVVVVVQEQIAEPLVLVVSEETLVAEVQAVVLSALALQEQAEQAAMEPSEFIHGRR